MEGVEVTLATEASDLLLGLKVLHRQTKMIKFHGNMMKPLVLWVLMLPPGSSTGAVQMLPLVLWVLMKPYVVQARRRARPQVVEQVPGTWR